jgi:hypothetical protein
VRVTFRKHPIRNPQDLDGFEGWGGENRPRSRRRLCSSSVLESDWSEGAGAGRSGPGRLSDTGDTA